MKQLDIDLGEYWDTLVYIWKRIVGATVSLFIYAQQMYDGLDENMIRQAVSDGSIWFHLMSVIAMYVSVTWGTGAITKPRIDRVKRIIYETPEDNVK